ncbi:MAG: glutathione S-transferase family protein [Candidatus Sericytochromatia bacterium]
MITLYQPPPAWGLPNASPFCMKLETYLRMAGIPFQVNSQASPLKAPGGKVPYIETDGRLMGDSGLIIDYLEARQQEPLDRHLSPAQKALALAIRRMLEEHLYFGAVYSRWAEAENWQKVRATYFGSFPPLLRQLVPILAHKKVLGSLKGQGLGRHSPEDLYLLCRQDIVALAELLGNGPYALGEQPSTLDACVYAFVANLLWVPLEGPLKVEAGRHPNLESYCQRIKAEFYA